MIALINLIQKNVRPSLYHTFTFIFTKDPPLYHVFTLFYNSLDLKKQIKSTFSLKTRGSGNWEFASWKVLPSCILQIVLKDTNFFKTFFLAAPQPNCVIMEGRLTYPILVTVFC